MTHRIRGLAGAAVVSVTSVASATTVLAQEQPRHDDPSVFLGVQGGAPLRLSGGATAFIPFGRAVSGDGLKQQEAVELQASGGLGGARVAGGVAFLAGPFGPDVLVSLTRTSGSPRSATPRATYVGVEGGFNCMIARVSVGLAQRVAGPSGQKDTIFTWQAAVQLPVFYKK
jgi:hypothetical protein